MKRVILASQDADGVEWLAGVLGRAGLSVSVVSDLSTSSPELKGAELAILDQDAADHLGDAGPGKRILLTARGTTVDLDVVRRGFADVLVLPSAPDEAVARVRHALES